MRAAGHRQRSGRAFLWILAGLTAAFVLLVVYQRYYGPRFDSDEALLARLKAAPLLQPKSGSAEGARQWPQWRGPDRDSVSEETSWRTEWPAGGPKVLWKKGIGPGYSAPVTAGQSGKQRVYTLARDGDDEAVLCFDAETGRRLWRFKYPGKYDRGASKFEQGYGPGPRSTPTVDGDLIYTVGATGLFHCLKADTGEKVWAHDLFEEYKASTQQWGVAFSPLVDGDLVFASPGGPGGNALVAFDKKTGKERWKNLDDPAAYSSPVMMTVDGVRQVVFFMRPGLVAVAPETGKLLWRFPWETSYGCNIATPVVADNYGFISSGYDRGCAVVAVSKAKEGSWQARRVYESSRMRNHFSSSVLYKGHLYGFDESKLICMDFRTGDVLWKEGGFKKGSLMVAGGNLIVLGENGKLAVAKASPEGFKRTSQFQASRQKCWTVPVLADGKLYVRDETDLICLDVRRK